MLFAQANPYAKVQKTVLIESQNDSIDLATLFWTQNSEGSEAIHSVDFFEGRESEEILEMKAGFVEEYTSFDVSTIHYNPKPDFSKKKDTSFIALISEGQFYVHPCKGRVTSRFGMRRIRYHYGVDIKARTGDSIFSMFDGVVRIKRRSPTYGFLVVVRHTNGLETYYAHLSKILVDSEQEVKAGDLIGLAGNTGRSRGSHLHFEMRYLGEPLNPEDVVDFESGQLRSPNLLLSSYHFRHFPELNKLKQMAYHVVRRGETLGSIAGRYHTRVSSLCRLNGIRSTSIIRVGQRLRVR